MRSAHITRHAAEAAFGGFDSEDVFAVQDYAATAWERAKFEFDEHLDALYTLAESSFEIDLTAEELTARDAFLCDFSAEVLPLVQVAANLMDEAA